MMAINVQSRLLWVAIAAVAVSTACSQGSKATATGGSGGTDTGGASGSATGGSSDSGGNGAGMGGVISGTAGGDLGGVGGVAAGGSSGSAGTPAGGASGAGGAAPGSGGTPSTVYNGLRGEGFNSGWKFKLGDAAGADQPAFDDSSWRSLSVPHDWSIELAFNSNSPGGSNGGYLDGGIGWYRKAFTLDQAASKKKILIQFDGVYMNSQVWLNGTSL